jgi:hypothetical protein
MSGTRIPQHQQAIVLRRGASRDLTEQATS